MGIVNLFSDVTYEGGASINGPFLATLGASAAAISMVAGVGEFLGYSLRSAAGWAADKTGRYWLITFLGYGINLLSVPAMALAGDWRLASFFILTERIGRALRKPTVEAMLSYSTGRRGKGWVYSLNTALDETGAAIGPLLIAFALYLKDGYRTGYKLLLLSSLLALAALAAARIIFPVPSRLEAGGPRTAPEKNFTREYWLYMSAGSCFASGLTSFELVSFHLSSARIAGGHWIPIFLALATVAGIAASLLLGKLYDKGGLLAAIAAVPLASLYSPLVFFGGFWAALAGLLLWGIGYAIQDTL